MNWYLLCPVIRKYIGVTCKIVHHCTSWLFLETINGRIYKGAYSSKKWIIYVSCLHNIKEGKTPYYTTNFNINRAEQRKGFVYSEQSIKFELSTMFEQSVKFGEKKS